MRIWLDRARLAAYRLTPDDVELALPQQNVQVPSGRIEGVHRDFTVLSRPGLVTPEEFGRTVLNAVDGLLVRIRDVTQIQRGPSEDRPSTHHHATTPTIPPPPTQA